MREQCLHHRGAAPRVTHNRMEQRSVPPKTIGVDDRARIDVGAVREQPVENLLLGEINGETFLINSCDGTRRQIREMPMLFDSVRQNSVAPVEQTMADLANEPVASRISIDLQERIRGLEQSLREERRALEETEQRYQELERKYQELLQQQR